MYIEFDIRKIAFVILIVACAVLGFKYYEQKHPEPTRTPIGTFYAMGNDRDKGYSNWHVRLYGADRTDLDELFKRAPLTALTNQTNYKEENLDKGTDPFLEIYRRNPQTSDFLHEDNTVVVRRWCRDLPYGGDELAKFLAEQIELSGLLPPPQS